MAHALYSKFSHERFYDTLSFLEFDRLSLYGKVLHKNISKFWINTSIWILYNIRLSKYWVNTLFFRWTIKAFKAAKNQRISNTGILKSNSKVGSPSFSISLHKYIFQHSLFQWTMTIMLALLAKCDILQMCSKLLRLIIPVMRWYQRPIEMALEGGWRQTNKLIKTTMS